MLTILASESNVFVAGLAHPCVLCTGIVVGGIVAIIYLVTR